MASLPGWNSVETTGFLHDFFELGGIILFLVVVGFELLAYFYGHRKDDLVAENAHQIEQNHQKEVTELHQRLSKTEQAVADRTLSPEAVARISERIRSFAGIRVDIYVVPAGSPDTIPLSNLIVKAIAEGQWRQRDWENAIGAQSFRGIGVTKTPSSNPPSDDPKIEAAIDALVAAFNAENLASKKIPGFDATGQWIAAMAIGPGIRQQMLATPSDVTLVIGGKP